MAGQRGRRLGLAFLCLWARYLTLCSVSLLCMMVLKMPKNEFGRTLWNANIYLKGQDLYPPKFAQSFQLNECKAIDLWNSNTPHYPVVSRIFCTNVSPTQEKA